jgi:hypothetical protein
VQDFAERATVVFIVANSATYSQQQENAFSSRTGISHLFFPAVFGWSNQFTNFESKVPALTTH